MTQHNIHIEGRRWFQRTYGNTYHTARVYVDGELKYQSAKHYGYGDCFIQTGTELLKGTDFVPADFKETQSTYTLRENYGISYSVADVAREGLVIFLFTPSLLAILVIVSLSIQPIFNVRGEK